MAGPQGQRGFMPGPQGQYQNGQNMAGWNSQPRGTGGAAGALGGGGRLGIGSNVGNDPVGGRTIGDYGGADRGFPSGGGVGERGPLGPLAPGPAQPPAFPGGGISTPPGPVTVNPPARPMAVGGTGASGFGADLTAMPDTTTATQIPQEAAYPATTAPPVPGYPPTPGSLTKLPTGGYSGMGPAGKPITYGKVMPGPIRRS